MPDESAKTPPAGDVRHFRYLDALRGIAILGVLFVHAVSLTGQSGSLLEFSRFGQRGVQLFYEISAFTLFLSMAGRSGMERHPLGNFFIRRFFRIAPLFYAVILSRAVWAAFDPGSAGGPVSPLGTLLAVFFVNGFHPQTIHAAVFGGWSIAVETTFYVFLPLLFARIRDLFSALLLTTLSGFVFAAVSYSVTPQFSPLYLTEYFHFFWFPIEFPVFAMGITAYFLRRKLDGASQRSSAEARRLSLGLLLLSVFMLLFSYPSANQRLYTSSLAFIPLILGLALHPWPLLVNTATVVLGRLSYSLYLGQVFTLAGVGWALRHLEEYGRPLQGTRLGFLLGFVLLLAGALLFATATHYLIELPGIALGKRLIAWREGRASLQAGWPPVV